MGKRLILSGLGLVLLAAAGLKLYGLNVAPYAQYGRLLTPTVQFLAVEWEIVLGIWLLTGRKPLAAWCAVLLTFFSFAGVSLHLGVIGQASCGCFGSLRTSPWHAFAVDVTALALVGHARPDFRVLRELNLAQWLATILRGVGLVGFMLALGAGTIGLTWMIFGSADAALAWLRGERVSIQPRMVDVGEGRPGQTMEAVVQVVNRTNQPVRLLGGNSDCSCVATRDLPVTLAPGETRQISIQIHLPEQTGFFKRKAFLWTDCEQARRLLIGLTGKIARPEQESAATAKKQSDLAFCLLCKRGVHHGSAVFVWLAVARLWHGPVLGPSRFGGAGSVRLGGQRELLELVRAVRRGDASV